MLQFPNRFWAMISVQSFPQPHEEGQLPTTPLHACWLPFCTGMRPGALERAIEEFVPDDWGPRASDVALYGPRCGPHCFVAKWAWKYEENTNTTVRIKYGDNQESMVEGLLIGCHNRDDIKQLVDLMVPPDNETHRLYTLFMPQEPEQEITYEYMNLLLRMDNRGRHPPHDREPFNTNNGYYNVRQIEEI